MQLVGKKESLRAVPRSTLLCGFQMVSVPEAAGLVDGSYEAIGLCPQPDALGRCALRLRFKPGEAAGL